MWSNVRSSVYKSAWILTPESMSQNFTRFQVSDKVREQASDMIDVAERGHARTADLLSEQLSVISR